MAVITGRNEVVAEVIFLHLFVILFTGDGGEVSASVHAGKPHPPEQTCPPGADTPPSRHPLEQTCPREQTPPGADTPKQTPPQCRHPRNRHPPWEQTSPRTETPPPRSRLRHTVNERPVRILLECILVFLCN